MGTVRRMATVKSGIEWTEATRNPVTGCSKVSPGCAHCYEAPRTVPCIPLHKAQMRDPFDLPRHER
jgi:hypothetical protein